MRCYNCGKDQPTPAKKLTPVELSICSAPHCQTQLHLVEGSTASYYCPFHQQEFPQKIKDLENKVTNLEQKARQKGSLATPSQELQELRTENQRLTTALSLKDTEQADLQAQIRALHSQLSERENNTP
jgi:septal ring factor EnvC (AmiA/AmiB activator)